MLSLNRWCNSVRYLACSATAVSAVALIHVPEAAAQGMSLGVLVGRSLTGGIKDLTEIVTAPGAEVGRPPVDLVVVRRWSRSIDLLAGAMAEVHLNSRWSVEVNALFRQLHGQATAARPSRGITPEPARSYQHRGRRYRERLSAEEQRLRADSGSFVARAVFGGGGGVSAPHRCGS